MILENEKQVRLGIKITKGYFNKVSLKVVSLKSTVSLNISKSSDLLEKEAKSMYSKGVLRKDFLEKEVVHDYVTACSLLSSAVNFDSKIPEGSYLNFSVFITITTSKDQEDPTQQKESHGIEFDLDLEEERDIPEALPEVSEYLTELLLIMDFNNLTNFTSE